MSSVSVTSSKREKETSELVQELEAVRTLNSGLRSYLDHLRSLKKNLRDVDDNCRQLNKVNTQWIETLELEKRLAK